MAPELWKGGEAAWPHGSPAYVVRLSDSYLKAAPFLAGRVIHVFETPFPADIAAYNARQDAQKFEAAKRVGLNSPSGAAMDRDHVPSPSYEAYVARVRHHNETACCALFCEEYIMTQEDYYHSNKYLEALKVEKRAKQRFTARKKQQQLVTEKKEVRAQLDKKSNPKQNDLPHENVTTGTKSVDKQRASTTKHAKPQKREMTGPSPISTQPHGKLEALRSWLLQDLRDRLNLWYEVGTRVIATDKYKNTYPATVIAMELLLVREDETRVSLQDIVEEFTETSTNSEDSMSFVAEGEESMSKPPTPRAHAVVMLDDSREDDEKHAPDSPKQVFPTNRPQFTYKGGMPNILVRVEVHFDTFRLQYNEFFEATSSDVTDDLVAEGLIQPPDANVEEYDNDNDELPSFHRAIQQVPTEYGSPTNAVRAYYNNDRRRSPEPPPTYNLVSVLHYDTSSGAPPADSNGVPMPFGTPFVVAVSRKATFADAFQAILSEARRFVEFGKWSKLRRQAPADSLGQHRLPFSIVVTNAGQAGSKRNPKSKQAFAFKIPKNNCGRICLGKVDEASVAEIFALMWTHADCYNTNHDNVPNNTSDSENEEAVAEVDVGGGGGGAAKFHLRAKSSGPRRKNSCKKKVGNPGADPMSISGSLNRLVEPEKLPGDYKCDSCKEPGTCARQMTLWSLPDFLVIQIKRFQYTSFVQQKIRSFVRFDIDGFDLSPWMTKSDRGDGDKEADHSGKPVNGNLIYDLYAVVNHRGGLSSGHYTTFALNTAAKECGQSSQGSCAWLRCV